MRAHTIRSSDEISDLFSSGKRYKSPYVTFIVKKVRERESNISNDQQHDHQGRVAFIAGKRTGNAVWRNRAKRRMRGLCRDLGGPWPDYDVIFLAKSGIESSTYSKVLSTCDKVLRRALS